MNYSAKFLIFVVLASLLLIVVNAKTEERQICLNRNVCPGMNLVDIDVNYFCRCEKNIVGEFCDRTYDDELNRPYRLATKPVNKVIAEDSNEHQLCVKFVTQCHNGKDDIFQKDPVCKSA